MTVEKHKPPVREVSIAPSLPQYPVAEKTVLGVILLNNSALAHVRDKGLNAADFFSKENRLIFQSMIRLAEAGNPIDAVTVTDDLHRNGTLEDAGGPAYVSQLADGIPPAMNCESYVTIIKEKATRRRIIETAEQIKGRAFDNGGDGRAILADAAQQFISLRDTATTDGWHSMFHTFDEFEAAAPLSFSINGFLQNNGATMFGGLSGHGKTLILLSIVKSLLIGPPHRLWGSFDVLEQAERVMYLIPESAIEPFKHRLRLFGIYPYLAPDNERLLVRTLSKGPTPSLSDPRILAAAKGAHVFLDTAVRFGAGDENDADDNRALAGDIFALLAAGARCVVAAHHSPKPFAKENVMRLENVLRGSGDIGAMLVTAWGIKQLDAAQNIIHVENIKPRDFEPSGPFQVIGRPHITEEGDFRLYKRPGECGALQDEQPGENRGGATQAAREAKAANKELLLGWLREDPKQTGTQLVERFRQAGISIDRSTVCHYMSQLKEAGQL